MWSRKYMSIGALLHVRMRLHCICPSCPAHVQKSGVPPLASLVRFLDRRAPKLERLLGRYLLRDFPASGLGLYEDEDQDQRQDQLQQAEVDMELSMED